ncbi:outer membrane transport energization protein ExbD [Trinickia symbiotica]|uniref:Biopolymer transporter ExbD n=1 Tax=Trinickia symbiotica TaxID=863227 RepID=A0A2N7X2S2_9BURK|nr:biopolymer transporter ExbD [Trinickia symbiotica]PMS35914.1 biopolymer transporter ExbD [Trinickia symbiotica]PPK44435.1 outer membrane transport energization protein ExbD [Trinickia symbiotica]
MKLRRSRVSKRGRIEIIPMIDVMFFLLATFMLTSLAMQRLDSVRIDLPRGQAQQMPADRPVTLSVNRENRIYINQQPVSLDQIVGSVKRLIGPDGDLVVAADDGASHGIVVQAMLEARKAGAKHFLVALHRE